MLRHFLLYGQSLSIGSDPNGGSVLSAPNPAHKMLATGTRPHIDQLAANANLNAPIDPVPLLPLVDLAEQVAAQSPDFGETMCSGIAAHLTGAHAFTSTGRGAYRIDQLSRDGNGLPGDQNHFHNTHAAMLYVSDGAMDQGLTYDIPAFGWKQGEADAAAGTTRSAYRAAVRAVRDQLRAHGAAAGHADTSAVPFITDQLAFRADIATSGTGDSATGYGSIGVAMIDLHRAGDVICVGPTYDAGFIDVRDVHFSSAGYRNHGERWGRVLAAIEAGQTWDPCHITAASRAGTTITLSVHVPVAPLVKDAVTFADRTLVNDGFDYDGANITSVTITDDGTATGTATIQITLDADAPGVLRVAYENAVVDQRNLVGSHFRDSDPAVTLNDGTAQPNWLCTDEWSLT